MSPLSAARTRATRLVLAIGTIAGLAGASGCAEERERLDVPRVYLELDTSVVAPGDSVRGRVLGADTYGGVVRLAAHICIDSSFPTARLNYDRVDSAGFRFLLPVPASTPENALLIVEAQVNDEQNFFVVEQDTMVVRSPGVAPGPSPLQPTCER